MEMISGVISINKIHVDPGSSAY